MRSALVISSTLHAAAVVFVYMGLPLLRQDEEIVDLNIIVEMVMVDDITRADRAKEPGKPKPKPKKAVEKPKPVAAPKPPPPAPRQVAAVQPEMPPPPSPPEPAPKPQKAEPLPEPVTKPKPKPKPVEEVKTPPKPPWKPKPPPKPQAKKPKLVSEKVAVPKEKPAPKKKKKDFSLKRIAALLNKAKKDDAPKVEAKKKPEPVKPPEPKKSAVISATAERQKFGQPLTISEVDAVRAKIEKCWSMPSGARDAEKLVVRIKFRLNPDGSIQGVPIVLDGGYGGGNNSYYRIAAEAARRAVQKCEPYDMLPRSKYKRWQDMEMTFDPKEMMGG